MILETKKSKIEIVLSTRKIIDLTKKLKGKNLTEIYFKALRDCDLEILAKIIYAFAEPADGTNKAFVDDSYVYDFLDDYMKESKKSYKDIYSEIAVEVNEQGFFNEKMTLEELQAKAEDLMSSINMEEIIKNSTEKAVSEITAEEFRGHKA